MRITAYLELLLAVPSLLFFPFTFEFLLPLFPLSWSQRDEPLEKMKMITYLNLLPEVSSLLFFLPKLPKLAIAQSPGRDGLLKQIIS